MVGLGFLMLGVGAGRPLAAPARPAVRDALVPLARIACSPIGFVAILAGWVTTEIGRQPWIVYGLMRTADGVTPALTGGAGR